MVLHEIVAQHTATPKTHVPDAHSDTRPNHRYAAPLTAHLCSWTGSTMGYVWVDGHMVCQDFKTYKPGAGDVDNPLPVNILNRSKVGEVPSCGHSCA
jgi:hypothetical protein